MENEWEVQMSQGRDHDVPRPIVRIGATRRHFAAAGVVIVLFYALGSFQGYQNLTHDPIVSRSRSGVESQLTGSARWWYIGLNGFLFLGFPLVIPVAIALTPTFAIRQEGLVLGRKDIRPIPWDRVQGCHWNRYPPAGMLMIQLPHDLTTVPIPKPFRAKVESELRRLGKWED
jgi:hypothetical protein